MTRPNVPAAVLPVAAPPRPAAGTGRRPRRRHPLAAAALAAALSAALGAPPAARAQPAGEPVTPQPRLPTIELQAGIHVIRAEVAADPGSRMRGLMMRERLGPNEGMLFVFDQKAGHCFWMRNTLVPLSIAFLDDDGTIANIADMQPQTENSHCPLRPVRYALEMERGWFARRGIAAGARLLQPRLFKPAGGN